MLVSLLTVACLLLAFMLACAASIDVHGTPKCSTSRLIFAPPGKTYTYDKVGMGEIRMSTDKLTQQGKETTRMTDDGAAGDAESEVTQDDVIDHVKAGGKIVYMGD
jgi:hypothetical protein